ncbi:MAG: FGGY-family carbohydrate kinase [Lachnospiraceae bacterium]|nr:FGGY-family carbohydrate kinase [Lachnospiraceae bacterium]
MKKNNDKYLGIELGSTRIKAVLIDDSFAPVAAGAHNWENQLKDGFWTYDLADVWIGIQAAYRELTDNYQAKFGEKLNKLNGIGISAMMHGYLPFDENDNQLVPFRTWRNTTTEQAAGILTEKLNFNIPQRWNVAHYYQAYLNKEEHVGEIAFLTTLAGYVHWKLTGEKVLGIGDASGLFPIDSNKNDYDADMLKKFDSLTNGDFGTIIPRVLTAGEAAGTLTAEGALLLDPSRTLDAGIPFCPPEGDAGTGMAATNSIKELTGNVSAGTSIFAMIVLEHQLSKPYLEIDMVTTPAGKPVAMVHCNSCTSDLDAWVKIFAQVLEASGASLSKPKLYDLLYEQALKGLSDAGGLLSYNYFAGEPITGLLEGRPLFARMPDSPFTLPNFMRSLLYGTMATLSIGMEILQSEGIKINSMLGHGGLFKTPLVGQKMMAAAMNAPISVVETASEGGAWGIALLAAYSAQYSQTQSLEDFLDKYVFADMPVTTVPTCAEDVKGYAVYLERYKKGLAIEQAAVESMKDTKGRDIMLA